MSDSGRLRGGSERRGSGCARERRMEECCEDLAGVVGGFGWVWEVGLWVKIRLRKDQEEERALVVLSLSLRERGEEFRFFFNGWWWW